MRIAALEVVEPGQAKARQTVPEAGQGIATGTETLERSSGPDAEKTWEPKSVERDLGL